METVRIPLKDFRLARADLEKIWGTKIVVEAAHNLKNVNDSAKGYFVLPAGKVPLCVCWPVEGIICEDGRIYRHDLVKQYEKTLLLLGVCSYRELVFGFGSYITDQSGVATFVMSENPSSATHALIMIYADTDDADDAEPDPFVEGLNSEFAQQHQAIFYQRAGGCDFFIVPNKRIFGYFSDKLEHEIAQIGTGGAEALAEYRQRKSFFRELITEVLIPGMKKHGRPMALIAAEDGPDDYDLVMLTALDDEDVSHQVGGIICTATSVRNLIDELFRLNAMAIKREHPDEDVDIFRFLNDLLSEDLDD